MASNTDTVSKLHDYAVRVKETDYHLQSADVEPDYEARINRTLQSLQNQVKQHQDALEKVRFSHVIDSRSDRLIGNAHLVASKSSRTSD